MQTKTSTAFATMLGISTLSYTFSQPEIGCAEELVRFMVNMFSSTNSRSCRLCTMVCQIESLGRGGLNPSSLNSSSHTCSSDHIKQHGQSSSYVVDVLRNETMELSEVPTVPTVLHVPALNVHCELLV